MPLALGRKKKSRVRRSRPTVYSAISTFFQIEWDKNTPFYNHNCQNVSNFIRQYYNTIYSYGTIERAIRKMREDKDLLMVKYNDSRKEQGWKLIDT